MKSEDKSECLDFLQIFWVTENSSSANLVCRRSLDFQGKPLSLLFAMLHLLVST